MVANPQEYVAVFPVPNPLHNFTFSFVLPDTDTVVPQVKHYPTAFS